MSLYNRQQGRADNGQGGARMTPTYSARSFVSQSSDNSGMSSRDGYLAASPITDISYDSYQEEYVYPAQHSQYGDIDSGAFQQDPMSHLELSDPNGLISHNEWPTHNQWLPVPTYQIVDQYQFSVPSCRDDHMLIDYHQPSDNIRYTLKSLRWNKNTSYIQDNGLYTCELEKGTNVCYKLKDPEKACSSTPLKVYLADPFTSSQKVFYCAHPFQGKCFKSVKRKSTDSKRKSTDSEKINTCLNGFSRRADLERHYIHVHHLKPVASGGGSASPSAAVSSPTNYTDNNKAKAGECGNFPCDRGNCTRDIRNPLGRLDHLRDHLKDFHKEDLGKPKKKKDVVETEEMRIENLRIWDAARVINPAVWRCAKCLVNNKVKEAGWVCGGAGCGRACEVKRRELRLRMAEEARGVCNTCAIPGMYYGQDCPDCGGGNGQGLMYDESSFDSAMDIHMYGVEHTS